MILDPSLIFVCKPSMHTEVSSTLAQKYQTSAVALNSGNTSLAHYSLIYSINHQNSSLKVHNAQVFSTNMGKCFRTFYVSNVQMFVIS